MNVFKKLRAISQNAKGKLNQDSRNNKAALTGVVTVIVRGISVGTGLISIPITAQYLGKEQFGLWLLLSTFMNWISLADLGLTNSLVNVLATALANSDKRMAKRSVSSAFFPMFFLGTLFFVTSIFSFFYISWEEILNLHPSLLNQDTRAAIVISICFFAIKLPLSIPRCVYVAHQKGYIYQLWIGFANLLSLLSLFVAQYYRANLPWLLGTFFGMIIIGDFFAGIDIFYFRKRWLKPELKDCDLGSFRALLKIGFQFWIAQICAICIFQTDLIIVSRLFGIVEVGTYGVLQRLFSAIDAVSASFISPLWPAYTDAKARGESKWIIKTFRNSIIGALLWSIGSGVVLVFISPVLLKHLINEDIYLSPYLPFFMMLTYVLLSIAQCIAALVNGLGKLKFQSFVAPISAITNLVLSILLGNIMGIEGITLATSICLLVFSIVLVGGNSILAIKQDKLEQE